MKSFLSISEDSHFSLENLPYGVFVEDAGASERIGVAIGGPGTGSGRSLRHRWAPDCPIASQARLAAGQPQRLHRAGPPAGQLRASSVLAQTR